MPTIMRGKSTVKDNASNKHLNRSDFLSTMRNATQDPIMGKVILDSSQIEAILNKQPYIDKRRGILEDKVKETQGRMKGLKELVSDEVKID